ncbi:MAG: class I SAM-dependent methyltransferase [Candidatus Dormibacteria bacterium]
MPASDREAWNRRYADADLVWSAQANRFLVEEVSDLPPGRALDLGAGEGRNAIWLAERGWRVTAVDFSDVGLKKARRLAEARGVEVDWIEADLRSYSPAQRAFDLVVLVYIHLPGDERRALVRRAADAVAAGGTLLVVGHDRSNLEEGWGGPQDPTILFSPDDITHDLTGIEGLHVVRADRVTRPVMTDDGERNAIDALVRAARRSIDGHDARRPV